MAKKLTRSIDYVAILILAWTALALTPLSWWGFRPGQIVVADTTIHKPAAVSFDRVIARDIDMSYSVVVRRVGSYQVACEARSGVLRYRADAALPENIDLSWWAPGDLRCGTLFPPGSYILETCWTSRGLFMGLIPDKRICRESNVFHVTSDPAL